MSAEDPVRAGIPVLARSLAVWAVAAPATAVYALAAMACAVGPARRTGCRFRVASAWARSCLRVAGCRLQVEQSAGLDRARRYVVMANHQSALDIPALLAALPPQLRPLLWSKTSLFSVPFLGWAMRGLGFVAIERGSSRGAHRALSESRRRMAAGRCPVLFPEQTYAHGEALLPFARGGFLLALREGWPVLPVGLTGTRDVLPPGDWRLRPGSVRVRLGEPVEVDGWNVRDWPELVARVRRRIGRLAGRSV